MARQQTAIVIVSKHWINTEGINTILAKGRISEATGDAHIVIATVSDTSDPQGLWLSGIKTSELKRDGSSISMKFMVPWRFVLGLGLVDDLEPSTLGFRGGSATTHEG